MLNRELSPRPEQPVENQPTEQKAADDLSAVLEELDPSDDKEPPKEPEAGSEEESKINAFQEEDNAGLSRNPDSAGNIGRPKKQDKKKKTPPPVPVHGWFVTFMCMNIPVIGWIYLMILAFTSKGPKKEFARAYLLYKLVFLILALAILAVAFHYGMIVLDKVLAYMEML